MTMLLTKAFCEENNIEIEDLLDKNRDVKLSVDKYVENREIKKYNDEIIAEIQALYGKKCRARLTDRLSGKEFAFGYKINSDLEEARELSNLVYKHGGILFRHLKGRGTLIVQDDTDPEAIEGMKKKGFEVLSASEIREICDMEKKSRAKLR